MQQPSAEAAAASSAASTYQMLLTSSVSANGEMRLLYAVMLGYWSASQMVSLHQLFCQYC